jgi:predicted RNase H-like nuclease (RuvC/YqgF family)
MSMGSSFGNSMGNPMGIATAYPSSHGMYAPKMTGGYVAKSKLKYSSGDSVRSKSMRSGMSRRSHLSKRKPTKRFNEELDAISRQSKASNHPMKPSVKNYRPQVEKSAAIEKPSITENKRNLDKIFDQERQANHREDRREENELEREDLQEENKGQELNEDEAKAQEDAELHDEIDSLYYGSNYSGSRRSGASRRSQLTSATYISKLEKELQEERRARENLAKELEEIKKISSEISSHLGLKHPEYNNN